MSKGHQVVLQEQTPFVYEAIACHPDILMCHLGHKVFHGNQSRLGPKYPGDIIYCGASTGKYFIHKIKDTDPGLMAAVKALGQKIINVNQGYSKCNILVVNPDTIITSDAGIVRSCKAQAPELNVIQISEGHILLPGLDKGFIGGTCGLVDDEIIFNGDISMHPDFQLIKSTILSGGKSIRYFEGLPLQDIGSIIQE